MMEKMLYTIGHSTYTAEKLIELLKMHKITAVVDVRSIPYSRKNPQFNRESFSSFLKENQIEYVFLGKELGARPDDPNNYINGKVKFDLIAETNHFKNGLDRIIQGMNKYRIVLMCAEKDPLICHRTILICRCLADRDIKITHILENGNLENHENTLLRLLEELNLETRELFRTEEEIINEAYSIRGEQIAYKKSESATDMVLREK